jgi:hypothetical protein
VLYFSAFPLRRARRLQAPRMFLIRPIDTDERRKQRLLQQDCAFWHSSLLTLLNHSGIVQAGFAPAKAL